MSLLFNTLSRFVIAFLPRSKCLLWLQSPSTVIFDPKKIKSAILCIFSPSICHEVMGLDAMIFVFWMLSFKPAFSLSSFTFIKRIFSSSSLSAIRVASSAYLKLFVFFLAILIPACESSSLAFHMMYSAYKLNKQGDNIQPWCPPFLILNQSVVPCLVLIVLIFLKRSLVFPIPLFSSISLPCSFKKAFLSPCCSLKRCIQLGVSFPFSLSFFFFPQLFVKPPQPFCLLAFLFVWDGSGHCPLYSATNLCPQFLTLWRTDLVPWICLSPPLYKGHDLGGSDGKASVYNAGDLGSIPGSGRSTGEGNGNPLQYYCLENPMEEEPGRLQSMGS